MAVVRGTKKRRVWWIIGGVLACLIILAVLLLPANSAADSRMKARLEAVAEKYGFKREMNYGDTSANYGRAGAVFRTSPLSSEQTEDVVSMLAADCPGCSAGNRVSRWGSDAYRIELRQGFRRLKYIEVWQHSSTPHSPTTVLETRIFVHTDGDIPFLSRRWSWWPW